MRICHELRLEQAQKLMMTPELRQAITVLQLSSLDLGIYIQQQLEENPLLELSDGPEEEYEGHSLNDEPVAAEEGSREYDLDWEEYFSDSSDLGLAGLEPVQERQRFNSEDFLSIPPTLTEHLLQQLYLNSCHESTRMTGEYLIGSIDGNGYLTVSVTEVAERLALEQAEVVRVLRFIQGFDPPGVGARDLTECLLIQADQLNIRNRILESLIHNHLLELSRGRLGHIAGQLGVTVQEVQQAADLLKKLDPKPGRSFSSSNDIRYITPDVVLEKVEGEYVILVNDVAIPRLMINKAYRTVLSKTKNHDPCTRRFVERKLSAAAWLLRSIEQRRLTLYKVAGCLVELQRDFLDYGVKFLKPLTLKKVAEMAGLHESTISRATSNKYIQTPQGVYEMKYFFCHGLDNVVGSRTSTEYIKKMLKETLAGEDPRSPLSDRQVADLFQKSGVIISRRTVAKYRDTLGILPCSKRKRY